MTLNLFSPFGPGPIGPGIRSWTQWIPEYTVPVGSHWEVLTVQFLGPPEQPDLRHAFPNASIETGAPYFLLGDPTAGQMQFPRDNVNAKQGDDVDYVIRLVTPTSLVLDEARLTRTWDATWSWRLNATSSSTGGFTQTDRDELALVKGAVWQEQTPTVTGALPLVGQVIDLLRGLPRSLIRRGPFVTIQGNGSIPAVPPEWNSSSGIEWAINQLPPGFGKDNGQVIEWHPRIAQFVVIRQDAFGNQYIDQVVDTHAADEFITWKSPAPVQIRYDLPPGVVLTVYYLGAVLI